MSSFRIIPCLFGLLLGLLPLVQAQNPTTQTAATVSRTDAGCVLLLCGSVQNAGRAADGEPTTAATITPPLALSSAVLGLQFEAPAPVGTNAALLLSSSSGVLDANLLGQISLRTYLGTSRTARQTMALSSLLNLTVLSSTAVLVQFPVQQSFDQVEITVGGVLNLSYSLRVHEAYAASATAPLPVTLTHFGGQQASGGVELSWTTAQELSNEGFVVERSADGRQFAELGRVAGASSTAQAHYYRYLDARPLPVGYYRLRQLDHDGTAALSAVVVVQTAPAADLVLFPVPAADQVTLSGPPGTAFGILNQLGQPVRVGTVDGRPVTLAGLPAGVYYLRNEATGRTTRFLKQ